MIHCAACGSDSPPGARFCMHCAAPLPRACAACGSGVPVGARFCPQCAHPMGAVKGSGAAPAVEPERTARAYTPKHLADKILQSRSALQGERKQVTVLFADVKGSMELAEQLDPEEWHRILERFFAILTEGVHRFEGTVNQYTGDGIMALFGAPIAHEDHAQRACYAALHMRETLREFARDIRRTHGLDFSTRMGLNSGDVIVGRIGDDLRMDYTAQGHTVGLAQRMESIAEPNTCFVTAATASLISGYFSLEDLGEFTLKGAAEPVYVNQLLGTGQLRTRLDASRSRGFSRFVGRGDEMQRLQAALARASEGNAQVIGIVGEAGLGKSRLCFEFLEQCRATGLMTYETSGVSHGKTIPFLPMLRLFRAFFGINEQDSNATARERIAGRLLLLDERLRESLPLLFDFMGVADPENPAPRIDPDVRQRQLFDLVRRVVQARGQKEVTVTLLEDLHWFDGGSDAFLEPLIDASIGTRSLVLLNFRPEYQAPQSGNWMGKSFYQQLALTPLGADAIRDMLNALLGQHESTRDLAEIIHTRTGGNPFFTEEVLQNLIETGRLKGNKGAYTLIAPLDHLEVPRTVHALLAARIDRLAEREKAVLQTAAVIGREFDEPTLAQVSGFEPPELREALQKLKNAEFIREQSLFPVAEYLFKHPLTQEVALSSQLQERRRTLHAKVAQVIEKTHAADLDQQAALLAHHWEAARDLQQAVRWHSRAGEWTDTFDSVAGLKHWHKVRALGVSLDDVDSVEARFRACKLILAGGAWRLGLSEEEAQDCLDETRSLAHRLGRPEEMAVPLAGFALSRGVRGQGETVLELATEALGMLDDRVRLAEDLYVRILHSWSLLLFGNLVDCMAANNDIIERSGADPAVGREISRMSPWIWAENYQARVLATRGDFNLAWIHADRAIKAAAEHDRNDNFVLAVAGAGMCAYLAGGFSNAQVADLPANIVKALELAESLGNRNVLSTAIHALAIIQLLEGDAHLAEASIREAIHDAETAGTGLEWLGMMVPVLVDACLARGDVEAAIQSARDAVTYTDAGGFRFQSALCRAALVDALVADALVTGGAPMQEVAALIAQARAIVAATGGNGLLPRLLEAEVRLAARKDTAALRPGLVEAESMYRVMGAIGHADRLVRELGS